MAHERNDDDKALHMWTVYQSPSDHPGVAFLARRSEIRTGFNGVIATRDIRKADTLDALRALLPPGLICLPRHPADDPVIVEVWF